MAVAHSRSASFKAAGPQASIQANINVGAGIARKLIAVPCVAHNVLANMAVASATYNGNALTQVTGSDQYAGAPTYNRLSAWFYDIPDAHAAGDFPLIVNFAGSVADMIVQWAVLTDAAAGQPGPVAAYTHYRDYSHVLDVVVAMSDSLALSFASHGSDGGWSHERDQVEMLDVQQGVSSATASYRRADEPVEMTDTINAAGRFVQIGFAIAPFGGARPAIETSAKILPWRTCARAS